MSACSDSVRGRPSAASRSSISEIRFSESSRTMSSCWRGGRKNLTACRYRSSRSMVWLRGNSVERVVEGSPFGEELFQHAGAVLRETIEALVALALLAPLADQQPLRFEAPQQRIQRPLVDGKSVLGKQLPHGGAPLRPPSARRGA